MRAPIRGRLARLERLPPRRPAESATSSVPPSVVVALENYCAKRWYALPWPLGFDAFNLRDPATAARLGAACAELGRLPDTTTQAEYERALGALLGNA